MEVMPRDLSWQCRTSALRGAGYGANWPRDRRIGADGRLR